MISASTKTAHPARHLQLCETVSKSTGNRRYYIDQTRVSREAFRNAKNAGTLDNFITRQEPGLLKHFCCARTPRWA